MTAIRLDPAGMRASGLQFVASCDALNTTAAQVAATALPELPPEMAARHRLNLQAVALRLRACAAQSLVLGEELQLRAAAAEAADAPTMGPRCSPPRSCSRRSCSTSRSSVPAARCSRRA